MTTQLLLIRGSGATRIDRPRSWQGAGGGWASAHSSIYICPHCHQCWAELYFEDDPDGWHPAAITAYCAAHSPAASEAEFKSLRCVPGSLFPSGWTLDFPLLDALPEALLRREALLTIDYYLNKGSADA